MISQFRGNIDIEKKIKIYTMKTLFLFLVFICFTSLCIGQPRYAFYKEYKKERVYDIYKIDSTKNYYLAQALMQKDSVLLVIDKQSVQLKNKPLQNS